MNKDLLGLGDLDIDEIDRRKREKLRGRNPDNQPEVTLEMWTKAHLTRDDQSTRSVVLGVVTKCLTDDYLVGDVVCSPTLLTTSPNSERRIYVTKSHRFECIGPGREVTIAEDDLGSLLPASDADIDSIKRKLEKGDL